MDFDDFAPRRRPEIGGRDQGRGLQEREQPIDHQASAKDDARSSMTWDLPPDAVGETVDSTRQPTEAGASERTAEGRLRAVFPRDLHAVIDLGPERVVLGRLPDDPTSPPLVHPTVSRSHFVIEWDSGLQAHVGKDLNSRNGAWVNGRRAKNGWHPLAAGSVLRIGDVLFVYEDGHSLREKDPVEVSRDHVPGHSLGARRVRHQLARAATDISPALIVGETGTGKEKIAHELHRLSGRTGEFVAINCAALGEHLIESQLFGHIKGAFTGATSDQPGLFRTADAGTLFLDEIGEMPLTLQPKLLRAIQEREIRAVGAHRNIKVDVRVVAATHRDLNRLAHIGEFRQDLYARLALWEIQVPSIRSRRSDILYWLDLLQGQWQQERASEPQPPVALHPSAAEALLLADWPENLRGLNRLVHELATRSRSGPLRAEDLPEWVHASAIGPAKEERR